MNTDSSCIAALRAVDPADDRNFDGHLCDLVPSATTCSRSERRSAWSVSSACTPSRLVHVDHSLLC